MYIVDFASEDYNKLWESRMQLSSATGWTQSELFVTARPDSWRFSSGYAVEANKRFTLGEVVILVPGTPANGVTPYTITKLTADITVNDIIAVVPYNIDNLTTSVTAKTNTSVATVVTRVDGLNEEEMVWPVGVNFDKAMLMHHGIITDKISRGFI